VIKLRPDSKLVVQRVWGDPKARLNGLFQLTKGLSAVARKGRRRRRVCLRRVKGHRPLTIPFWGGASLAKKRPSAKRFYSLRRGGVALWVNPWRNAGSIGIVKGPALNPPEAPT
jgi:hypothetical protein